MWIFTSNSFLSIVDKGDPTGETLLVRARKSGDIESVFSEANVQSGGGTDYAYRARISREEVSHAMSSQIDGITYSNFKNSVKDHDRHDALMGVWQEMYNFQTKNLVNDPSNDLERNPEHQSIDPALIEQYTSQTYSLLKNIGHELLSEISLEMMGLTTFLSEYSENPAVDVTLGSFASIQYRFCEVFKQTATIAGVANRAIDSQRNKKITKTTEKNYIGEVLATYQAHLEKIADMLEALDNGIITFLPCDLAVLKDHPEVARKRHLVNAIKLIDEQLGFIQERLYELCGMARHQSKLELLNEAPPLSEEHKNRAWEAMSATLQQCIEASLEEAESPTPPQEIMSTNKIEHENNPEMKTAQYHPKLNNGVSVKLENPSRPSALANWKSSDMLATATPESKMPDEVNGIAIKPWTAPRDITAWEALASATQFDEPEFQSSNGKATASGAVIVESDGRVWVVSPSNQFGGYKNTFPKGKAEANSQLSLRANALKEVYEEAGLKVELTGFLCDSERTTSTTRYYLARRVGGSPAECGWESQAVHLVPRSQLSLFASHKSDLAVLKAIDKQFPKN